MGREGANRLTRITRNPTSKCSTYTDFEHRFACRELAGDDPVGECVKGCLLLDQYDTNKHTYTRRLMRPSYIVLALMLVGTPLASKHGSPAGTLVAGSRPDHGSIGVIDRR